MSPNCFYEYFYGKMDEVTKTRRIQYAGSETDGLSVDYKVKYAQQLQVIKDNYATFAVPYNGEDNNDYVDGKVFRWTLPAALGNLQTSLHSARLHGNSAAMTAVWRLHRHVLWQEQ